MRRVVVTGMGIVSAIGNNAQEVLASLRAARSGIVRAEKYAELGFRCQVHGAPTLERRGGRRPPRHALSRRRHGLEPCRDGAGDRRCRPRASRHFQSAHRHHHGLRRPLDAHHRRSRRYDTQQGPEARRPVRGAEGDVVDRFGDARDLVQDQGRQLFDLVGLRDLDPLHRQCRRNDPIRQAGRDVRRRLRGARLDAVGSVRCDGGDVVVLQRAPARRLARLRQEPRRLRHRRRRRGRRARGIGARQGARREDLCRARRLWRDLGRLRHGRALGRGGGALHAHGARNGEDADRLHQSARHFDAGRRSSRRSRRSATSSAAATNARRSPPPNRSPAIRSARPACRRRSIPC